MPLLVNTIAGPHFGLGLLIAGMADPAKVQTFVTVFGGWDASLAFVIPGSGDDVRAAAGAASAGCRLIFFR